MMQGGDGPKYENWPPLSTSWNYDCYIVRSTPCTTWEVVLGRHSFPAATVSSALQTLNDMPPFASSNAVVLVRSTKYKALLQLPVAKKDHARRLYHIPTLEKLTYFVTASGCGSLAFFLGQTDVWDALRSLEFLMMEMHPTLAVSHHMHVLTASGGGDVRQQATGLRGAQETEAHFEIRKGALSRPLFQLFSPNQPCPYTNVPFMWFAPQPQTML